MLESEAKLAIQQNIRTGNLQLAWSYIMDYENNKNPFQERKEQIGKWKRYATTDIEENTSITEHAKVIQSQGLKNMDALHIACAISGNADYFLTTDDKVLKKSEKIQGIIITDPIDFIKQVPL